MTATLPPPTRTWASDAPDLSSPPHRVDPVRPQVSLQQPHQELRAGLQGGRGGGREVSPAGRHTPVSAGWSPGTGPAPATFSGPAPGTCPSPGWLGGSSPPSPRLHTLNFTENIVTPPAGNRWQPRVSPVSGLGGRGRWPGAQRHLHWRTEWVAGQGINLATGFRERDYSSWLAWRKGKLNKT